MKIHWNLSSLILYCFGFILVLEWIWPVQVLTDTANIWVFIVFLAISFFVTFLGVPLLWSLLIKGTVILYFLHWLYFEGRFLQFTWVIPFMQEMWENFTLLFSAGIPDVSNLFRSLLFFILLWLMTYLLHYWLIQKRKLLLFFFITITYITVLDTFTPYDATKSIVRTVITGFFCLGVLAYYRLKEAKGVEKGSLHKWLLPLSVMLAFSVMLGLILPKQAPLWPDPVPYIQAFNKEANKEPPVKKVGYGSDDSRLGGPFIEDNTVVFLTETESDHYWKVETKDVYTGKGWLQSKVDDAEVYFSQHMPAPIFSFAAENKWGKKLETSYVYQMKDYPHILYPLGITHITSEYRADFKMDSVSEKVYSLDNGEPVILPSYAVTFEKAVYQISELKKVVAARELERDFMQRYTQLPDSLPERVRELAKQITAGKNNWYDKAKAIEQYFKEEGFSYDTENVLVPGEKEDYVEQFLFESKRGYCDNFSTSMTVLLRALDIPARWVKGYTAGEYSGSDGKLRHYEITNNNAHSWVEVYFPNVGWVTFEPTPGFSNGVQYQADESTLDEIDDSEENAVQEAPAMKKEEPQAEKESDEEAVLQEEEQTANVKEKHTWKWVAEAVFIILGALLIIAFWTRRKWLPHYYIWRLKGFKDPHSFSEAYLILLKSLQRSGLKREKGQTLREYARAVDERYAINKMSRLTDYYERYLYGNETEVNHWDEIRELWEYLIKKTRP